MAMKCKYSDPDPGQDGTRTAYIISDAQPTSTDGKDIENFPDGSTVSFGSICEDIAHDKKYKVGLDGDWHEVTI